MPITAPADWIPQLGVYAQQRNVDLDPVVADRAKHETIKRYALDFAQNVDCLRTASRHEPQDATLPPFSVPHLADYYLSHPDFSSKQRTPRNRSEDDKAGRRVYERMRVKEQVGEVPKGTTLANADGDIDWFAYYLAETLYYFDIPQLIQPRSIVPGRVSAPDFTFSRWTSATARLHRSLSAGPWEKLARDIVHVVLWKDCRSTLIWIGIYLTLMMTSSFLVCLLGLLLYYLVKPQFVPPLELVGEDDAGPSERSPQRSTGEESRTSKSKSTNEEPESPLPTIAGKSRKMSKVLEWRKTGMAKVKDRTTSEATRSRISLVSAWETFQQKHGAQIVLVLNDLADIHEKLMNLYAWKRPEASIRAAIAISVLMVVIPFASLWMMLRLSQAAVLVTMFFFVPVVARMSTYEPIAFLFGDAPTDSEHALDLIRKHGLQDENREGLESFEKNHFTSHTTAMLLNLDQKRLSSLSFRGAHARLEADRQHRPDMQMEGMLSRSKTPGERFDGFKENRNGAVAVIPNTLMISEITTVRQQAPPFESSKASGVIREGTRGEPLDQVDEHTYFARHGGNSGTLAVSTLGVRFAAFRFERKDRILQTNTTDLKRLQGVVMQEGQLQIPMSEITGVEKTHKSMVGLSISSGLDIETQLGGKFLFPFVANRNEALYQMMFLSSQRLKAA